MTGAQGHSIRVNILDGYEARLADRWGPIKTPLLGRSVTTEALTTHNG